MPIAVIILGGFTNLVVIMIKNVIILLILDQWYRYDDDIVTTVGI